jgi:hypothetical protein
MREIRGAVLLAREGLRRLLLHDRERVGRQRRMQFVVGQQLHAVIEVRTGACSENAVPAEAWAEMSSSAF